MQKFFEGKKIRDKILTDVKQKIDEIERKPGLAVVWIGGCLVCGKYVELKRKIAQKIGVNFFVHKYEEDADEEEIIKKINELNEDKNIDGIMIQMPVPDKFDKLSLVHHIKAEKDVDGLRFCCGYHSEFEPPVVLAITKAIELSGKNIKNSKIAVVGRGFLVGWPLAQCLEEKATSLIVADSETKNLGQVTRDADILISAAGKVGIIRPDMIRGGIVLIDAGTTETKGTLQGDIDQECFKEASYYTPVPGGIGPVTIAMLMKNLVK